MLNSIGLIMIGTC